MDNYLWEATSNTKYRYINPLLEASDFNNVDVSSMINQTTDKFYNDVYLKFDVKYSSDERGFPIIEYCQENDDQGWLLSNVDTIYGSGWSAKVWNSVSIRFNDHMNSYRSPESTDWTKMDRLQVYAGGKGVSGTTEIRNFRIERIICQESL